MCSETSSPRISFSHDLPGDGSPPVDQHRRRDLTLLDSNLEFEFSISIEHESSSSADELFSNGIILPIKIQSHKQSSPSEPPFRASLPPLAPTGNAKEAMKQITVVKNSASSDQFEQRASESKSFWGFKRSSSLNFESKRSSLCPLPLLSRSNSTGSVPNPKSKKSKDSQKQISQKQHSTSMRKLSPSSSSSFNQYAINLKPQMNKTQGGVYGNYHCIGPVLNVPPKFFGLGSLLRCGKDRKSKT
ncbi:uncharacterized protein LOC111008972 [Momordica charantia]|uniref:Uncharacterized protein LOC111008972 n=1 Tax=Momordica charantia TaxID=3673 RepID=A0A6J1C7I7_MOMCH|nr:uncharacterized protein LOC111008972 [Momordica charantia]